jgi:hypothetical protein
MEAAIKAILSRDRDIGTRQVVFDVYPHPHHDAGVLGECHHFLRPFLRSHNFAIAMFDRDGCGSEAPAERLRQEAQNNLTVNGWRDRSAVFILDPELEIWVWANSPRVATALGWKDSRGLTQWLRTNGYLRQNETKPTRPKEAMHAALRAARKPKSTAIYQHIASGVRLEECTDRTFMSFVQELVAWFPQNE